MVEFKYRDCKISYTEPLGEFLVCFAVDYPDRTWSHHESMTEVDKAIDNYKRNIALPVDRSEGLSLEDFLG